MIIFSRKTRGCWVPPFLETSKPLGWVINLKLSWSLPSNSSSFRAAGPSRHSAREASLNHQPHSENLGGLIINNNLMIHQSFWKVILEDFHFKKPGHSIFLQNSIPANKISPTTTIIPTWHSDRNGALSGPVLQWLETFCLGCFYLPINAPQLRIKVLHSLHSPAIIAGRPEEYKNNVKGTSPISKKDKTKMPTLSRWYGEKAQC